MTDIAKLCERLRTSATAFREHTVYDSEGDPLRLIVQADELDEAADLIERLAAMLAASPQGEGSSADASRKLRFTVDRLDLETMTMKPHIVEIVGPAPIKPSADTGELRERVTQIIEAAIERHNPGNSLRHTVDDADAILDLIQSERGSL